MIGSYLAAVCDDDINNRLVSSTLLGVLCALNQSQYCEKSRLIHTDFGHNVHSLDDLSEHDMASIQPRSLNGGDEL